jgi:hypothetical protein
MLQFFFPFFSLETYKIFGHQNLESDPDPGSPNAWIRLRIHPKPEYGILLYFWSSKSWIGSGFTKSLDSHLKQFKEKNTCRYIIRRRVAVDMPYILIFIYFVNFFNIWS